MDTEALRTFLAIYESGGFSSAAIRLARSQPAISRRIAQLEAQIGLPLFERTAGGITLSEAGGVLLPHARRVLAALEDGAAALMDLRTGSAGPVSIAAVGTLAGAGLTATLKRFAARHPRIELTLRTATSNEVSDLVKGGAVTLGLRYHADTSRDLDCRALQSEALRIVCAPEHPLAGQRLGSLRRLGTERWLAFPSARRLPETSADNLFGRFLALGVADLDWVPVDSITAQKRLVEAGYGLAVLPRGAIDEELSSGSLATISVRGVNLANPVCLITRRGGYLSVAARELIELLDDAE